MGLLPLREYPHPIAHHPNGDPPPIPLQILIIIKRRQQRIPIITKGLLVLLLQLTQLDLV